MEQKKQAHVSEKKKNIVRNLEQLMKKKTIMIVSVKNLPSPQLQEIRKKLKGKAIIKIAKKSSINHALEDMKEEHLKELENYVKEDCAIMFSDGDAFELSLFLSENKSPAKAKAGQEAPDEIKVEAGPTSLIPGPDISLLSSAGLQVKVENGKLAIQEPHVILKKGDQISETVAAILAKLDITPFKIGLEPMAAFSEGKIYTEIKIDKEKTLEDLKDKFSRGLAFSVSIDYFTKETMAYLFGKAVAQENVLSALIKTGENTQN